MLDNKFDNYLTQIQINSFQTMSAPFGDSYDLESPGRSADPSSPLNGDFKPEDVLVVIGLKQKKFTPVG